MTAAPIVPVTAAPLREASLQQVVPLAPALAPAAAPQGGFASMLTGGIDAMNAKVQQADTLARAFALDDSIPVHQVTYALEQARISLEVMAQMRTRLIDGYQQIMNMQL